MKRTIEYRRWDGIPSLPETKLLLHASGVDAESDQHSATSGLAAPGPRSFQNVLVPLDGTLRAEHALPHALAIARRTGATLRIVHAYARLDHAGPWHTQTTWPMNERLKREKQNYLRSVADRIALTDFVKVETILVEGTDIKDSIHRAAEGVDLIVMASSRKGFVRRLFSPSVSDELRHGLPHPILLVRGYPYPADLTGDPVARRILVPLDGSALAERIVEPATKIGGLSAALTLLNVQNSEWTQGVFDHSNPKGYLLGVAHKLKRTLPKVEARIVTADRTVSSVVASYAEEHKFDLVALTASYDERFPKFMRKNVVDALLRRTNLPILTLGGDIMPKREAVTTVVG